MNHHSVKGRQAASIVNTNDICIGYSLINHSSNTPPHYRTSNLALSLITLRSKFFFLKMFQIQVFHFLSRPGGLAQELQAGTDAGIHREATDGNPVAQLIPSISRQQLLQNGHKLNAMKRIAGVLGIHQTRHQGRVSYWKQL